MLRAVSAIYVESQTLEVLASARRDIYYKFFRTFRYASYASSDAGSVNQTVLASDGSTKEAPQRPPPAAVGGAPPPPPPRPPVRRAWALAAAAAVTASLGGVYFYRKLSDEEPPAVEPPPAAAAADDGEVVDPSSGASLPARVHYLLVGGGTASFAAMRALRSLRPEAHVLIVGAEPHPPYMRPPLSKELWREPALGSAAPADLPALSFRQWNGKRRALAYEPLAFYTPAHALAQSGGGAALARGWRVAWLDVRRREAELRAPGREPARVLYDECLLATGSRARRLPALDAARAAGRVFALRDARDAVRLARELDAPGAGRVLVVGGGFLASELSAALADRLGAAGRVTQLYREAAPLWRVLPPYLAREAARRLAARGVALEPRAELVAATPADGAVAVRLRDGRVLRAACVVECVGAEPALELARAAGLEEAPAPHGGLLVTAELQARAGVWAAGDVACFYDAALGRRRVEHHDHAVVSGRLAGENMAGVRAPQPYTHQSMLWSDLGPDLGYEAIGIVDSRLPTVGVFSEAAVTEERAAPAAATADGTQPEPEPERRFERGVVFYTREKRVVGVLLWNLFNRMHVARQVLAQGEFEDLFEVAKLFSLHEDD